MESPCFVYVIGYAESKVAPTDTYKVGITGSVDARLKQVSTGSPHKVQLDFWIECPTREYALAVETLCHRELAAFRVNGEWFVAPFSIVKMAVQAAWRLVQVRAWSSAKLANDAGEDWRAFSSLCVPGMPNLDYAYIRDTIPEELHAVWDIMRDAA